jgi:glycine hydroxymethyltransferase
VVANARALANTLIEARPAHRVGRTESHVMLVDLRPKKLTGKEAEAVLGKRAHHLQQERIPNDPEKPFVTSGIRLGSPAMTTRGFGEAEAVKVGNLIADVLDAPTIRPTSRGCAPGGRTDARFPVYR